MGTAAPPQSLAPTPSCVDDDVRPEQMVGPFFTPDSPGRTSLREPGIGGAPPTVSGFVLSTACEPVAGALLDSWQCDDAGEYDNEGYRLRGHQFAGDDGSFRLETIRAGLYPGRTRDIHVKVQAPGRPVLTTQLYFPGELANATDGIFRRSSWTPTARTTSRCRSRSSATSRPDGRQLSSSRPSRRF